MNKPELIKKIKDIDALSSEEKTALIELINHNKRYGLVWENKPEDAEEFLRETLPVLKEISEKRIQTNNAKQPNHVLIEGDNLHALTALSFTHQGQIDVIYIDPPYNTGSNDFKYNDKFVDREDSYRHSKWLSFMSKRLKLAKNLLKSSGIIFISIDDNEQSSLKHLCDEIFGENNFHGVLTWVKRTKSTNSGKAKYMIQPKLEYIHTYGKITKADFKGFRLLSSDKEKKYPHTGILGACRFENIEATDYGRKKRDTMKFPILGITPRAGKRWQIGEDEAKDLVSKKRIEVIDGIPKKAVYPDDEEAYSFIPFWAHFDDTGSAEEGKKELSEILGPNHNFDTVKPVNLLIKIIERFSENIVVLDFFAGSGTTLHATMELNDDGGSRQCILVTNNESNICEEITYERNKRVIQGYTNAKGEKVEGLTKNNLRYFKTEFVSRERSLKNKRKLTELAVDLLRIKENCYTEIKGAKHIRIFNESELYVVAIADDIAIPRAVELIQALPENSLIMVYVFSEEQDPYTEDFYEVLDKIELCALPDAIYKAYQHVLPKKKTILQQQEA